MLANVRSGSGHATLCAAIAVLTGAALLWFGPPGTDLAAHVYQRHLLIHDGFALWNNFWYAGRYSFVGYSLTYYPLAALLGIKLLATVSVAASSGAFALVAEREWDDAARWPARMFAVIAAASVVTGAFPYLLGVACALTAIVALQRHRLIPFALLAAVTLATSPLAFLFLVVVLLAAAVSARQIRAAPATAVAVTAVVGFVLSRVFPSGGRFPYSWTELAGAIVFCMLGMAFTWRVPQARLLFTLFATYAVASALLYVVPSAIGENVARLRYIAIPVAALVLTLRKWRPLLPAVAAMSLALSWNLTPIAYSLDRGGADPSSKRSYWAPSIRFLRSHLDASYRVEAVDTIGHWDAAYLAEAGIPIVRGWFRQSDFPQNELLYDSLGRASYLAWLRSMGVRYVVLTTAPADYSARGETRLLRSGRSGLVRVFQSPTTSIFSVPSPRPIITGPSPTRVVILRVSSLVFRVGRAGTYHVAIRYTPYWTGHGVCIKPTAGGMFNVRTDRAGLVRLRFAVTPHAMLRTLIGARPACATQG